MSFISSFSLVKAFLSNGEYDYGTIEDWSCANPSNRVLLFTSDEATTYSNNYDCSDPSGAISIGTSAGIYYLQETEDTNGCIGGEDQSYNTCLSDPANIANAVITVLEEPTPTPSPTDTPDPYALATEATSQEISQTLHSLDNRLAFFLGLIYIYLIVTISISLVKFLFRISMLSKVL